MIRILQGVLLGLANIIPGISGGTVAVLLGIYEDLTGAIGNFFLVSWQKKWEYFCFLMKIFVGAFLGILFFSSILDYSIGRWPIAMASLFTALILPTVPHLVKKYKKSKKNMSSFCFGMLFLGAFTLLNLWVDAGAAKEEVASLAKVDFLSFANIPLAYGLRLLVCGLLAGGAMIVPGVSGSLLLLVMGEYANVLSYVHQLRIIPLLYLALGVALGLLLFSKIISWILESYHELAMFFISGMVLMSIPQIWLHLVFQAA